MTLGVDAFVLWGIAGGIWFFLLFVIWSFFAAVKELNRG